MSRNKVLIILAMSVVTVGVVILSFSDYDRSDILVVIPNLTANAYSSGGFYDYFEGRCGEECLTVQLDPTINHNYSSSSNAIIMLLDRGYDYVLDLHLVSNEDYLNKYDSIVILHNEYMTQEMFNSITSHPKVFYMYPNALYGEVEIEIIDSIPTMTLISGHGVNGKDNAFDWEHENTRPDEFDNECLTAQWNKVSNGWQLDCYPDNAIMTMDWIIDFIEENK